MRIDKQFNKRGVGLKEVRAPEIAVGPGASDLGIRLVFRADDEILRMHLTPEEARALGKRLVDAYWTAEKDA